MLFYKSFIRFVVIQSVKFEAKRRSESQIVVERMKEIFLQKRKIYIIKVIPTRLNKVYL